MSTRRIRVLVELPVDVSQAALESATRRAREAAVVELWRRSEISTSLAARELDLAYHEFLDLLTARGLPISSGELGLEKLEAVRRKLAAGRTE